jgi:hypothetical protein
LAALIVPISYRYDVFTNRLMTRCEGRVSQQQAVDHFRQLDAMHGCAFIATFCST